jgi:hypothetical protein
MKYNFYFGGFMKSILLIALLSLFVPFTQLVAHEIQEKTREVIVPIVTETAGDSDSEVGAMVYQLNDGLRVYGDTGEWLSIISTVPHGQVRVNKGAATSHGSTGTMIRCFTSGNASTIGTAITYSSDSVNGDKFTVNEAGIYSVTYWDARASGLADIGISVNASSLTTSIDAISASQRYILGSTPAAGWVGTISTTMKLAAGDIVRAHTGGVVDETADAKTGFIITQVQRL